MWMLPEQDPLCTSPNEESGPFVNKAPLTNEAGKVSLRGPGFLFGGSKVNF